MGEDSNGKHYWAVLVIIIFGLLLAAVAFLECCHR